MDTATPAETATPAVTDSKESALAERRENTRFVRFLLKGKVAEDSALLPTDAWAKAAVWDFAKTNKSLHKTAGGMAGFALGAVAVVVAGMFGAVAVAGIAPIAAIAVVTMGAAGFLAKKSHDFFNAFKSETLPLLRNEIGLKYLGLKANEINMAWQKKKEEHARKKAADKAKAAEAPKAEVKVDAPATVAPANAVVAPDVNTVAPKVEEKPQTVAGTVGSWLLKKALEQATKKKDAPAETPAAPANPAAVVKDKDKKIPPPKAA